MKLHLSTPAVVAAVFLGLAACHSDSPRPATAGVSDDDDVNTGGSTGAAGRGGASVNPGGAGKTGSPGKADADATGGTGGSTPDAAVGPLDASGAGSADARSTGNNDEVGPGSGPFGLGGPSLPCAFDFCESFEGYNVGTHPQDARWVAAQSLEQIVVDNLKPARGSRALHITWEAVPKIKPHWLRTNEPFPKLSRKHFGRVFVWIQQLPDKLLEYRHWVTVQMHPEAGGPVLRVLGGETPSNNILKQNSAMFDLITPGEDRRREDKVNIGAKTWHCFEWSLDVDANQYRMWLDGKPMTGATWDHANPKYTFAPITYLWLGWTDWHPAMANWEVFLDEFVLHSDRVGCDK